MRASPIHSCQAGLRGTFHLALHERFALDGGMFPAALCLIAFAYFCGALPFGYWAGRMKGIDIRQHGSGNIGATNVIRVLGKKTGIPVFILDMLKGFAPTFLAAWWMKSRCGADANAATLVAVLCAAAAVLGHTFTFWLGFKGGKGVATYIGILAGLYWPGAVVFALVWLATAFLTRYSSLSALVACTVVPFAAWLGPAVAQASGGDRRVALVAAALSLLVFVTHRGNIARLLAGTESKIGARGSGAPAA